MKLLNLNFDFRFSERYFQFPPSSIKKLQILTQKINQSQPEIITLQEVPDILGLAHLKKAFGGYGFVFKGFLRVNGGLVTLYDRNKWKFLEKYFVAFTEQGKFFSKQLAGRIMRKGILVCVFKNLKTRKKWLVMNVHLTANYGQRLKEEEREILKIQLDQIRRITRKHKLRREIVAGDFNADFQSRVMQRWIKRIDFQPAIKPGSCTICPTTNPLRHYDQQKDYQIDNVLVSKHLKATGKLVFNKKGKFLSDHLGQLAEIGFK